MKITFYIFLYLILFCIYEYLNSVAMTDTWPNLFRQALNPIYLIFFALSPLMVWAINKLVYDAIGQRFWFMGVLMGIVEFAAYLIGAFIFYKKFPTLREGIAFTLILIALLIAGKQE